MIQLIPSRYSSEKQSLAAAIALLLAVLWPHSADVQAQDLRIEEVVTIGTRVAGRTAEETAVPVDVFNSELLGNTGHIETARLLQQLAPSFNFGTNNISDGSDSARPATLRGLGPDHVLVLVNGKRHVGQAWMNVTESLGRGATGVDFNTIPVAAIDRIEVLRDGASSQYGSDAIAGVVNLILKENSEGTSIRALWGSTYEGDGDTYSVSLNQGFSLPNSGFLNLSFEARERDFTNRAERSNRTVAGTPDISGTGQTTYRNAGIEARPTAGQTIYRFGDGDDENWLFMANGMIPITDTLAFYLMAKYSEREGQSTGFYRFPFQANRAVPQVHPNGFLPLQNTDSEDWFIVTGFRGEIADGWSWDFSANYGVNEFSFGAENTINASIAAEYLANNPGAADADIAANAGPTSGDSGTVRLGQLTFNYDVIGELDLWGSFPLHIAFGAEYRDENYELEAGDKASYSCGLGNGTTPFSSIVNSAVAADCGFQAFPGYSPAVETDLDRASFGLYVDFEKNFTERWLAGAALRYEDYEDVGQRLTGKLSSRIQIIDEVLALRGAFSTGFRAPSLPQLGFTSIVTQSAADGVELAQTLIASTEDPFSAALGIDDLDFETSNNYSLGFVLNPWNNVSITADVYRIDIDDRIALSGRLGIASLRGLNLDMAADSLAERGLDQASVFFNAIETETNGIDLVISMDGELFKGILKSSLAYSYTNTNIEKLSAPGGIDPEGFYNREARSIIEDFQPHNRATLAFDWRRGPLGIVLRTQYFDETSSLFITAENSFGPNCGDGDPSDCVPGVFAAAGVVPEGPQAISDEILVDLEFSYAVTEQLKIAAGGNNIFDERPDKVPGGAFIRAVTDGVVGPGGDVSLGNVRYPIRGVSYGVNGGFYYLRASYNF